jgi:hypothetical protein
MSRNSQGNMHLSPTLSLATIKPALHLGSETLQAARLWYPKVISPYLLTLLSVDEHRCCLLTVMMSEETT